MMETYRAGFRACLFLCRRTGFGLNSARFARPIKTIKFGDINIDNPRERM